MVYPKRRAPVACNLCRQRKRRCTGERPTCSLCKTSQVDCQYSDIIPEGYVYRDRKYISPRLEDSDVLRRLEKLESIVGQRQQQPGSLQILSEQDETASPLPTSLSAGVPSGFATDDHGFGTTQLATFLSSIMPEYGISSPSPNQQQQQQQQQQQASPRFPVPLYRHDARNLGSPLSNAGADDEAFTVIPHGHHTITASLFSLEPIKNLIGDYPSDFLFQIESSHPLPTPSAPPRQHLASAIGDINDDREGAKTLISQFFASVQPIFPIVDQDTFAAFFQKNIHDGPGRDVDVALCLAVLALGELANSTVESACNASSSADVPGMSRFSLAHHLLTAHWVVDPKPDFSMVSGLIICALYFLYLDRPLPAWNLVNMASSRLQLLVTQSEIRPLPGDKVDLLGWLCWACYVLECDSLAEFHLPRSGIEFVVEKMPFPHLGARNSRDGMQFLALCSIRRLLNRIHNAVYTSSTKAALRVASPPDVSKTESALVVASAFATIKSLESILMELAWQIETWYSSLPVLIKPDLSTNEPGDSGDTWLRLRYWSAKHVVGRPCLFYAASVTNAQDLPLYVLEFADMCIRSCRNYIETALHISSRRAYYNWMVIQALLAYSFTLTIASKSPVLKHLVSDLDELISKAVTSLQLWATPDSTAEFVLLILKTLQRKQRLAGT